MAYNVKEIVANKPSRFTEGHRMCAGCGAPVVARHILRALKEDDHAVISTATGCMAARRFVQGAQRKGGALLGLQVCNAEFHCRFPHFLLEFILLYLGKVVK